MVEFVYNKFSCSYVLTGGHYTVSLADKNQSCRSGTHDYKNLSM